MKKHSYIPNAFQYQDVVSITTTCSDKARGLQGTGNRSQYTDARRSRSIFGIRNFWPDDTLNPSWVFQAIGKHHV